MTVTVKDDQVSITCATCGAIFAVTRASMSEEEWGSGARDQAICEASRSGWSGGKHAQEHLCPVCSAIPDGEPQRRRRLPGRRREG